MKQLSAIMRCFVWAYHHRNYVIRVFDDPMAEKLLAVSEQEKIMWTTTEAAEKVYEHFKGSPERAARLLIESVLMPRVLGQSAFCENALRTEIGLGCEQYVILNAGFDTYALRNKSENLRIFELDERNVLEEKSKRLIAAGLAERNAVPVFWESGADGLGMLLNHAGFNADKKSFFNLMGLSTQFERKDFSRLLTEINRSMCKGSAIALDYYEDSPGNDSYSVIGEKYTEKKMEQILDENGFLIYENLNGAEMTQRFFRMHGIFHRRSRMTLSKSFGFCLAVKHREG